MKCSKQVQEQIPSLVANELSGITAWRLKRHCRTCPTCRAQWEQTQQIWAGLKNIAAESITDQVRASVFAQLSPGVTPPPSAAFGDNKGAAGSLRYKEMTMRKRLVAATGAVLVIAVTGTFAAQLLARKAGAVIGDRAGHMWHISSNFRGEVRLYDPQNKLIGTTRNMQPGSTPEGVVELDVSGAHLILHGTERREVRDSNHTLLGYAELTAASDKQVQEEIARTPKTLIEALRQSEEEESKYGGVSGVSASPLGANGWDRQIGVSWKVRGQIDVTVFDPAGKVVGQANSYPLTDAVRRQLPPDFLPPAVPRVEITVQGKMHVEHGYGSHNIKNATGKLLLRLEVKPLSSTNNSTKGSDGKTDH